MYKAVLDGGDTVKNKKDKSSPHGSSVLRKAGDKKNQCYEEKNIVSRR